MSTRPTHLDPENIISVTLENKKFSPPQFIVRHKLAVMQAESISALCAQLRTQEDELIEADIEDYEEDLLRRMNANSIRAILDAITEKSLKEGEITIRAIAQAYGCPESLIGPLGFTGPRGYQVIIQNSEHISPRDSSEIANQIKLAAQAARGNDVHDI